MAITTYLICLLWLLIGSAFITKRLYGLATLFLGLALVHLVLYAAGGR